MIERVYIVTCNICETEFDHKLGGPPTVGSMEQVKRVGWLVLYENDEPNAAICPTCLQRILETAVKGAGR